MHSTPANDRPAVSRPDSCSNSPETSRLVLEKFRRYVDEMNRQRDSAPPLVLARAIDRLSVLVERLLERAT